jgi:cytochrome c biogenesis protein
MKPTPQPSRWIAHFGSLRSTLALFGLMAAVVLLRPDRAPLAVVIGLMAVNLLAALVAHPAFRRQLPLLVAHLALLALVLLVALGRMTALDGRFELTQGVPFDGSLLDRASGPLHIDRLQRLALRHDGLEIDYAPGRKRGATRNTVAWVDEDGRPRSAQIGDHHPLLLQGYRIYTSPNKGYAPLLQWQPAQGEGLRGAVHLPSFPAQALRQSQEWQLPDGRAVWVQLQGTEGLLDPGRGGRFELPAAPRLVVRLGDARAELAPGEGVDLPGGRLVFEELRTWMGYRISADPTLPWLLAAALLAALALGLHYVQKFGLWPRWRAQSASPNAVEWVDG